ncbi:MAG: FAD-binding domain-containing protein [Pseudomonadota bacterium]
MRIVRMAIPSQTQRRKTLPLQVVWFKRDLRVHDHAALAGAAAAGPVLPLFVAEPGLYAQPDAAGRHWAFLSECLEALQCDLVRMGQPLIVATGDVVDVLNAIHAKCGIDALWSHEETGNAWTFTRDKRVSVWCRGNGVPWHEERQFGVIRRLKDRNGWAKAWDRQMAERQVSAPSALPPIETVPLAGFQPCDTLPTLQHLGLSADPCPGRQRGGRLRGIGLLNSFLTARGQDYRREMSSPVTAFEACSRLSAHLAYGSLSMREITQTVYARMADLKEQDPSPETRAWRASLSSFAGRLHWHCHFMQKLEDEPRLEFENLHPAYVGMRPDEADRAKLAAWCNGETGFPFVDACMRALHQTGWLNFRMRAMMMSFASYHLWLPWRATGEHLARQFTDYEPGIHWPQSQMQSGTTGINTVRIYNPVKQSEDQDPAGTFIRSYCPELAAVPDNFIHAPWTWDGFQSEVNGRYPERIVDHVVAARAAREAIYGVRKSGAFRQDADKIQSKHGSRKSGIRHTGQRGKSAAPRKRKSRPSSNTQLDLDL